MGQSQLDLAIAGLVRDLNLKFQPPEFIPGCVVQDVTDINDYATDNGWIEALCGRHNQQRVRYKGFPAGVQANDIVDVVYYPSHKFFEVHGVGGATATSADKVKVSKIYEPDLSATVGTADNSGHMTFSGDVILDSIGSAVKGSGSVRPDLGTSTAAERWGSIFAGGGEQFNCSGDYTFTVQDAWNLKDSSQTWLTFSGAAPYAILAKNSTAPDLGSTTAAERFGSIFVGGSEKIDANGSFSIEATAGNAITINDDGVDVDFAVEGTGVTHALFVQGSDGFVGINDSSPGERLSVSGNVTIAGAANDYILERSGKLQFTVTGVGDRAYISSNSSNEVIVTTGTATISGTFSTSTFLILGSGTPSLSSKLFINNNAATTYGFVTETGSGGRGFRVITPDFVNTTTGSVMNMNMGGGSGNVASTLDAYISGGSTAGDLLLQSVSGGNVGIDATPSAKLHIDQVSTTAAIPVLYLDQADISEEFIFFRGSAAAATLTQSIVAEADVSTATRQGFLKIFISDDGNQVTDQAYFVPFYTLA